MPKGGEGRERAMGATCAGARDQGTRARVPRASVVTGVLAELRPDMASAGYGLFLAVNAAGVWGGVFPFLPLWFQTPTVVLWFFLMQSLAFALAFVANAALAYLRPGLTRVLAVKLAALPYMLGWCLLIAATYLDAWVLPLVMAGGALLGLGVAQFNLLWQRLFASQEPERGTRDLVKGTAFAAVLYFALYLIPVAVTAFLIPFVFLPLFGLAVVLLGRQVDLGQPMFEDVPREHAALYRHAVGAVWRSAFCVGGLGFCAGIMRALAVAEPAVGSLVNALSMAALLVAALALLACWRVRGVRLNVVTSYRVCFPFVITGLCALPLMGVGATRWLAALLYALYSVGTVLMMMRSAQTSRDSGINPVFIYGVFAGVVYLLHDVGFVAGSLAGRVGAAGALGVPAHALVALVAVWLLGLIYFVGQGGFRGALGRGAADDAIEMVAPPRAEGTRAGEGGAREAVRGATSPVDRWRGGAAGGEWQYRDRLAMQAEALRRHYGLSAREAEVMELVARGGTVPRIAEELVVSENTVRTHSKRIYAKLGIHKKQELLDLIEEFDPHEVRE